MYLKSLYSKIEELKRRRRAVILAHNYQVPEVQDVADFVGDSLELAKKAREIDADVIVLAGVRFMAEIAAVLNPDKVVLHPNPSAGCPLADYLTPSMIREYRRQFPEAPVVVYVNSYVEAKAEADYIVTSASAAEVIKRLDADTVIFGPDKNLAEHVATLSGKSIIAMPPYGNCPVHEYLLNEYYVRKALEEHPNAKLIAHPETPRSVRAIAHFVGSTSQMLKAVKETNYKEFILATEEGIVYRARKIASDKQIYPANPLAVCIDMKKITLLHIVKSLENLKHRVVVEPSISKRVREVIEQSLDLVKG